MIMVPNEQGPIDTVIIKRPTGEEVAVPIDSHGKPITPKPPKVGYDNHGRPVQGNEKGTVVDEKI